MNNKPVENKNIKDQATKYLSQNVPKSERLKQFKPLVEFLIFCGNELQPNKDSIDLFLCDKKNTSMAWRTILDKFVEIQTGEKIERFENREEAPQKSTDIVVQPQPEKSEILAPPVGSDNKVIPEQTQSIEITYIMPNWMKGESRDLFKLAALTFVKGIKNVHTQRSYKRALLEFFGLFNSIHPKDILTTHVELYIKHLEEMSKSAATIETRLGAISAFYNFLTKPQGASAPPLVEYNPVQGVKRVEVDPYANSKKMTIEQAKKFFSVIDRTKPDQARDYVIFQWLFYTARRINEMLSVKKSDLTFTNSKIYYKYRELKNRKTVYKEEELPPPVWTSLQDYWILSEVEIGENDHLFQSESNNGKNTDDAISDAAMRQKFTKYCHIAGLKDISIHSLRHVAAHLFEKESGLSLREIQNKLGHKDPKTTQVYLEKLDYKENDTWKDLQGALED